MPTIDELAPASSASDSDEFIISQGGVARKITRSQILNGVQDQILVPAGSLIGNFSSGTGNLEAIAVGENLVFSGSTLSAIAAPFVIDNLPEGLIPASGDLLPISQGGTAVAVSYGQLVNGISAISNINLTQALITPAGAYNSQTLGELAASMITSSGGTVTGGLMVSMMPTTPSQVSNKAYVDQQISTVLRLSGGSLAGVLTLAGSPQHPLDSVTKNYADTAMAAMVPLAGGSMCGSLLLSRDPANSMEPATKQYADQKLSRAGDTLLGPLSLAGDPILAQQAATKNYVDAQVFTSVSKSGGTLTGALFLASDPTFSGQAATKQYADQRILRTGDTLTGPLVLATDPMIPTQAATKNYVDVQFAGSISRGGSSMGGALLLASDPAVPLQASTKQYVDLRVNRAGDSLSGALLLAGNPTIPLQAATKQYVDSQLLVTVTASGATFTGPVILAGAPSAPEQAATKQYADTKLSIAGDTLQGVLVLAGDPVTPTQAATKNYVDSRLLASLALSGGSLTGSLSLSGDPTLSPQAATKHYVDAQVALALPLCGGSLTGLLALAAAPENGWDATTKQYVDTQVATALPRSGGTLTGAMTLPGLPTTPLQAATKGYVDANPDGKGIINVMLPPYGAKIDGVTDDTAAFVAAYQAAPSGSTIYVPSGTTVLQQPGNWGVSLTKRVRWIVAGTVLSNGTPLASAIPYGGGPASLTLPGVVTGNTPSGLTTSQGSSQSTDFAVNQSSYIVNHNGGSNGAVISNVRSDTIIYNSPGDFVWGGIDRLIWSGTQTPNPATPAQHVARYVQTLRASATVGSNGSFLPAPQLWGACIEYRDTTGQPSSATNAALTIEMDWFGNGHDDASSRQIQSLVIGQNNLSGAAVEVSNIIGVWLSSGSSGSAKTVFNIQVPYSNAVLDASNALAINNAPVVKLAAGQAIAFESTNSNRLLYDTTTSTLRWNQGTQSYVVGKGITVGWGEVYSASTTLPSYLSGTYISLNGATPFSITLPSARTVAAGTGFTFSVEGGAAVNIIPAGSDGIDSGPIVLHLCDRYHIVSDGTSYWHEVFWTNAVSPRFLGPMVLPSFTVANLPSGVAAGAKVFASNGRKPGEVAGSGSGVELFFDGQHWISSCSGTTVTA